jgi:hypothetical protein
MERLEFETPETICKGLNFIARKIDSAKSVEDLWHPEAALLYLKEYLRQYEGYFRTMYGDEQLDALQRSVGLTEFYLSHVEGKFNRAANRQELESRGYKF